jgi:uncharacterized YccA/Bax inhibitor family protein
VRETSNPVFRSLSKQRGGYAQFGTGVAPTQQGYYQANPYAPYQEAPYQEAKASRPVTIDDVVTKTGITLALLSVVAVATYFFTAAHLAVAVPLAMFSAIAALLLIVIAIFTNKYDSPPVVLSYAALEGVFVGAISFVLANFTVGGRASNANAGGLIAEAILGTIGVFIGMLVVYKTGAIRVTPKLTRIIFAGIFGVVVLGLGNLFMSFFTHDVGPLRNGGPIAIVFSLVCIGLASFKFLIDFDAADQIIRAGAPEKAAWGVALALTVTLVWLYVEILQLLRYFQQR